MKPYAQMCKILLLISLAETYKKKILTTKSWIHSHESILCVARIIGPQSVQTNIRSVVPHMPTKKIKHPPERS